MNGKLDLEKQAALTAEEVRRLLDYDPETGIFRWKVANSRRIKVGDVTGYQQSSGNVVIRINTKAYVASRLAWLYMTGEWPPRHVDHENLDPGDNRWTNLRKANKSQNGANRGAQKNNVHGHKCVYLVPGYYVTTGEDAWRAEITGNGRSLHIGYFRTSEEAQAAYLLKAKELFGEFARVA